MKIMIFNTLYFPYRIGGAEVSVQILAEELVRLGHDVRVVSLTEGNEKKSTILNGVDVKLLPLSNIYWPFSNEKKSVTKKLIWHALDYLNVSMYYRCIAEIEDFNPDLVHTNNICGFSVLLWKAVKKKNIKLVHTSRDYYLFHPNSTLFHNDRIMTMAAKSIKFWSALKRRYSVNVDEYVGISNFIKDLHDNNGFFKNARNHVIYNAVSEIHSEKNKEIKRIGFIGRLSKEKGFDIFCDLARKYKKSYSFIAAGNYVNNNDKESLENLAELSSVSVKGYMNLHDFLNQVDAVVLPIKWNEPFGRTVVECVLAGKLVLTNSVGAMTELSLMLPNIILVNDYGVDFEENIKNFSTKKINPLLIERFKPENIAKEYLRIYKGACGS